MTKLGTRQIEILKDLREVEAKIADENSYYRTCLRLLNRGLVDRGPKNDRMFRLAPAGREALERHEQSAR